MHSHLFASALVVASWSCAATTAQVGGADEPREASSALAADGAGDQPLDSNGTLFFGGTFYDSQFEAVGSILHWPIIGDALFARSGRIVAVGRRAELEARYGGAGLRSVDLRGAVVFPGLQDAHGHVEALGAELETLDLAGLQSTEELIERVRARVADLPLGTWVTGRGWQERAWNSEFHHGPLSAAIPDHPVILMRSDNGAALVNERALLVADLLTAPERPLVLQGGRIHYEAEGRPTGLLVGSAVGLVAEHVPQPTQADRRRRIRRAQDRLLSLGVTCVHDMGVDAEAIAIYRELRAEGELELRIVAYLWADGLQDSEPFAGLPIEPDAADRLTVIGAKLHVDGHLDSRSAALVSPYADAQDQRGHLLYGREALERKLRGFLTAGLQPAVHAAGDEAVRLVLDAFGRTAATHEGFAELRPRLEHAIVVAPGDVNRAAELGVVTTRQAEGPSERDRARERLGDVRFEEAYAGLGTAGGAPLALGSDFPVRAPGPLRALSAALDNGLALHEALHASTIGPAYAVHQEGRRGRLAPGYGADFTALDLDGFDFDAPDARLLAEARTLMTVVNGEIVYRAGEPDTTGARQREEPNW